MFCLFGVQGLGPCVHLVSTTFSTLLLGLLLAVILCVSCGDYVYMRVYLLQTTRAWSDTFTVPSQAFTGHCYAAAAQHVHTVIGILKSA
jgi:hypothetical protein